MASSTTAKKPKRKEIKLTKEDRAKITTAANIASLMALPISVVALLDTKPTGSEERNMASIDETIAKAESRAKDTADNRQKVNEETKRLKQEQNQRKKNDLEAKRNKIRAYAIEQEYAGNMVFLNEKSDDPMQKKTQLADERKRLNEARGKVRKSQKEAIRNEKKADQNRIKQYAYSIDYSRPIIFMNDKGDGDYALLKKCMDYLHTNVGKDNVYNWYVTDKSLIYYDWGARGKQGKKHVVSLDKI